MKLLDEDQAKEAIQKGIAGPGSSTFAVAFWGEGAIEALGIEKSPRSVAVICNLKMGGTNPAEIVRMMKIGVEVRQCDDLHGKVYLFDDHVIVGSSNASANGLGFQKGETSGWREANVLSTTAELVDQARAWIERLRTRAVTKRDIDAARIAWSNLRRRPTPGSTGSLLNQLKCKPTFFDGKGVYLAVCSGPMNKEGKRGLETAKNVIDEHIDAFQSWPELPNDGYLVNFSIDARRGIEMDGLFERRPIPADRKLRSGDTLQLCWPVEDVLGFRVLPRDLSEWSDVCKRVQKSSKWDKKGSHAYVDLADVARKFLID